MKNSKNLTVFLLIAIIIVASIISGGEYYKIQKDKAQDESQSKFVAVSNFSQSTVLKVIPPDNADNNLSKPPTQDSRPTVSKYPDLRQKNIFIVEGNPEIIYLGTVYSDLGLIDRTDSVRKENLLKKFFNEYPEAKNKYDFIFIATTFKPNDNIGEFGALKNNITGVGDGTQNINVNNLTQYLSFSGKERVQGYAFVMDLQSLSDDLYLMLHEMSHRWLFHLGDYDSCGKGFSCTRETGYKINNNGSHYNEYVNTTTKIGTEKYADPNGGGSMEMGPVKGYCLDYGGSNSYRFTSLSMYLMGFIPANKVVPLKWYETTGAWSDHGIPCVEHTFGVSDVVSLVGKRSPSYPNTQKDFSVAYILLTRQGKSPTQLELDRMKFIAENFPHRWSEATWFKSAIK